MKNSYTEFSKDVEKYMTDKLPNIDPATATEIGAYLSSRVSILIQDMMNDYAKRVEKQFLPRRKIGTKDNIQLVEKAYNELVDNQDIDAATGYLGEYLED
jgi:DNA polymerase/3'-5' exonuclease PolX